MSPLPPPRASNPRLAVHYRRVDALKADPAKPRLHKPSQIKWLARSIEASGFVVPVLVDADGRVVAGHARLLAAKRLGLLEVPVIALEHLSAPELRALMLA